MAQIMVCWMLFFEYCIFFWCCTGCSVAVHCWILRPMSFAVRGVLPRDIRHIVPHRATSCHIVPHRATCAIRVTWLVQSSIPCQLKPLKPWIYVVYARVRRQSLRQCNCKKTTTNLQKIIEQEKTRHRHGTPHNDHNVVSFHGMPYIIVGSFWMSDCLALQRLMPVLISSGTRVLVVSL